MNIDEFLHEIVLGDGPNGLSPATLEHFESVILPACREFMRRQSGKTDIVEEICSAARVPGLEADFVCVDDAVALEPTP